MTSAPGLNSWEDQYTCWKALVCGPTWISQSILLVTKQGGDDPSQPFPPLELQTKWVHYIICCSFTQHNFTEQTAHRLPLDTGAQRCRIKVPTLMSSWASWDTHAYYKQQKWLSLWLISSFACSHSSFSSHPIPSLRRLGCALYQGVPGYLNSRWVLVGSWWDAGGKHCQGDWGQSI